MRYISAAIILVLVFSSGAYAEQLSGSANAITDGAKHIVSVAGWYGGDQADYEFVYLRRTAIGVCEPEEHLYQNSIPFELAPWSGPGLGFSGTVEIDVPDPRILYLYQPYAVASDGNERIILNWCATDYTAYALVSSQEAPFLRGRLELNFGSYPYGFRVIPCEEDCWSQYLMITDPSIERLIELAGEGALDLVGEVVDVYGTLIRCQLLGADSHDVTRIELAPAGMCGPVPISQRTWGEIKSMYR